MPFLAFEKTGCYILQNRSPHKLMHGALPDLQILKVFGSLVYASTLQDNRTKLDPRGRKCIFLGYKQGVKGTILFDLNTKDIFISRNVTHYEHILPYQSNSFKFTWHYHSPPPTDHICPPLDQPNSHLTPSSPIIPNSTTVSQHDTPSPLVSDSTPASLNETPSPIVSDSTPNSPTHTTNTSVLPPTRPIRQKHTPSYLSDYVYNSSLNSLEASSSGTLYPISAFHSFAHLSPLHSSFTAAITHCTEPHTYAEACKNEHWKSAMNDELEALAKNKTWIFVDLPPHVKPIGSKWVYKIKHKADGTIERYKARLVAKGYNQIEGLDFFDTFSPVAKLSTVRILLAIASIKQWHLHQLDVNNAFLHGELQEDVYMTIPQGVSCSKANQVCKLVKSLYGLKQASRKWYERLTSLLLQQGYRQSTSDYSLFTL
jgi:hypothetical protein